MDPEFLFDAASSDEEAEVDGRAAQSPWEFASYSESVAEEHARRNTTSIDAKITRVLQERAVPLPDDGDGEDDEEPEPSDEVLSGDELGNEVNHKSSRTNDGKSGTRTHSFFASHEGASFHANSFIELNLSRPLLRACEALGYQKPTPIQAACIPLALAGRDICGSAITGSGKTAAFTLPVLERLLFRPKRIHAIRVLILTPTRELAAQVHSMVEKLAQFTDIRCCLVVGGLPTKVQEAALRSLPDIVVATPGRIIDHLCNSLSVGLEDLAVVILDEADRLLELGFSAEIHELVQMCPKRRQTMLFSATMTEEVDKLVRLSLNKPVRLEADPSSKRPATLTEEVVRIRRAREVNQESVLLALCSKTFTQKVIVFSGTKQAAHRLKIIFGLAGLKAAELHGNLTQAQRLDALEQFRKQEVDFLIATDVAARGLDIVGVQTVINFACPRDYKSYLHRVGRTARAGREGYAVTFLTDDDRSLLKAIAKKAGSLLKSRIVAERPVTEWSKLIEQMEDQISAVIQEEREERILRKAEMEANKAENMIMHKEEIFSRPKRTWFATEKEKKALAKAAKESLNKDQNGLNKVMSAQEAEELKLKEKRKREREKNLPRKKRRRLEAAREMLENEEEDNDEDQEVEGPKSKNTGQSLVDLAYRRAKSVKAMKKMHESGKKLTKTAKNKNQSVQKNQTRKEEMLELFQDDMSDKKQARITRNSNNDTGRRKSKNSFKSKSRYKRRK
ncbi:DEAD-box ATP-dependent RNA helicase 28 isoform X2 [Canna indica]|uniref:DEAD-box ATP-dependent RNA helicase 28 isoform X2 n=1 Tax=Canna indica TaxID=4628 RepID=A0AAQ3KJK8_9LILI|nr:DEAD-box ATP-dependent RNA helicase 28 isoform X2 [Canna indica]